VGEIAVTVDSHHSPLRVEVITYTPTRYTHCQHCEVTWQVVGVGQRVHREQLDAGLPDDLAQEFRRLSDWVRSLPDKFGDRVQVRLVDAASIEGFFKSLVRRFRRYPAFTVEGERYVGSDFAQVDALISSRLAARGS
jgi:hypothetical protein